jgi:hypothetical protein
VVQHNHGGSERQTTKSFHPSIPNPFLNRDQFERPLAEINITIFLP